MNASLARDGDGDRSIASRARVWRAETSTEPRARASVASSIDALARSRAPMDRAAQAIAPAPTTSALDACRCASWASEAALRERTFRTRHVRVPADFVRYVLRDGVACGADDRSLPRRVEPDAFDAAATRELFGDALSGGAGDEVGEADARARAAFAAFAEEIEGAIRELGGAVAPKFAWSAPKDATWVAAGGTMRCRNADEVVLLLKASDAVTHDLTEAYNACVDYVRDEREEEEERVVREHASTTLALREWFDLNPSLEFRCFVKSKNLVALSQRHVNDFYEFLLREKEAIEDAIAEFWEAHVSTTSWHANQRDYVFDVYVTPKTKKVKLIDFNVWGGTTLPLLFDWHELEAMESSVTPEDDERGYADNIEFRIIESQGHIRPGLQLGVPYDLYDTSEGSAISEFLEAQRRQQESEGTA